MPVELTPDAFLNWMGGYERAWRTPGTDGLALLFTGDASYLTTPYAEPISGLADIAHFWEEDRKGPDEVFTMEASVVACSGDTGVARVLVQYGSHREQEYLDLWVVRFEADGRVSSFEEWPFWPSQGRTPVRTPPVVTSSAALSESPYDEWVRADTLSAGVYRLPAGGTDTQTPHEEDEVYVVTAGAASLDVNGAVTPVSAGSVAYVPRRVPHRFVDITDDLEVSVVFAPPET